VEIEQALRQIIAGVAEIPEDSITHESHFANDLGMDSMDAIEAMVLIESEFNIDLLESSVERVSTFGDLVEELAKFLEEKARSTSGS
jgi:NADH dehydrogenase (ubiquinone) 1 alpha/beta subcomplex 1